MPWEQHAELKFAIEERRGRINALTTWLPRIAVAVAFLAIGVNSVRPTSSLTRTGKGGATDSRFHPRPESPSLPVSG